MAKFKNGAAAITLHKAGKGEVIVFWGLPDYKPENMPGVMDRWQSGSGAGESVSDNPLPLMRGGRNTTLNRHYALIYNDRPGTIRQKITFMPDGDWFIDDMVSDQRWAVHQAPPPGKGDRAELIRRFRRSRCALHPIEKTSARPNGLGNTWTSLRGRKSTSK